MSEPLSEKVAPNASLWRFRGIDNQQQLDSMLDVIERLSGIETATVGEFQGGQELYVAFGRVLEETEVAVLRKAIPDGEYSVARTVLKPITWGPAPGRSG